MTSNIRETAMTMRMIPLVTAAMLLAPSSALAVGGAGGARDAVRKGMAIIPAGFHERLHGDARTSRVRVPRFALDRDPVTRRDFLAFVRDNPGWRKGEVKQHLAGRDYLSDWSGDTRAGTAAGLNRPVTSVSWYAAKAYCEARGKRLPSVDEWEYAAAASETKPDATREPGFISRLLGLYGARAANAQKPVAAGFRNVHGVRGMHDLAWEWTADFKPGAGSHSHQDGASAKGHQHDMFCASSAIGAANPSNYPAFMRYAIRAGLDRRSTMRTLGFRCAASLA